MTPADRARIAREYAECAAVLDEQPDVAGAAALFDQALTNGLVAIVGAEWPGDERNGRQTKPARALIRIIEERCPENAPGVHLIQISEADVIQIDVRTLLDALDVSQPTRHARGGGGAITRQHIQALLALDDHGALGQLHGELLDKNWRRTHVADRQLIGHAASYLEFIGEAEADRRAETIGDYLPADPKESATAYDPQLCPVCDRHTLIVNGLDDFGEGVGSGMCIVCSYERSDEIAYWEAASDRIARHVNDD